MSGGGVVSASKAHQLQVGVVVTVNVKFICPVYGTVGGFGAAE
jgi:hypothetical protein